MALTVYSRGNHATVNATSDGAPSDSDFGQTPPDGTLVVDTTNDDLYVRTGGAWLSVSVT